MNHIPEQPRSPSLEDLLRLKRAERPDADFWQDFERGLRAKQLAAIVEPKPWWLGFSILLGKVPASGWAASGLSAGAAAVFAVMSITANTADTASDSGRQLAHQPAPESSGAASPATLADVDLPYASVTVAATASPSPESELFIAASSLSDSPAADAPADLAPPADAVALASTSAQAPQATLPAPVAALPANTTILLASADSRATTATDSVTLQPVSFLDQAETRLDRIATPLLEFVASGFSTSPAMITGFASGPRLAVASTQADNDEESVRAISPRHARLLHAEIPYETDEKDLSQARDRVVHRLSDSEELYASVTRLGVRGDRLSLSF